MYLYLNFDSLYSRLEFRIHLKKPTPKEPASRLPPNRMEEVHTQNTSPVLEPNGIHLTPKHEEK